MFLLFLLFFQPPHLFYVWFYFLTPPLPSLCWKLTKLKLIFFLPTMQLYSWLLFTLIIAVNCSILMKEPSGVKSNIDILDVLRSGIHRTPWRNLSIQYCILSICIQKSNSNSFHLFFWHPFLILNTRGRHWTSILNRQANRAVLMPVEHKEMSIFGALYQIIKST